MAARPPKPPGLNSHNYSDNQIDKYQNNLKENLQHQQQQQQQQQESVKCLKLKKPNCICTNISIMHLFHEMKQKFPTVPDHIVNQCVIDNCHDRENCIRILQNELALHPTTSPTYPSSVLIRNYNNLITNYLNNNNSNNNNNCNINSNCLNGGDKPVLKPIRPAPVPNIQQNTDQNCNNTSCNSSTSINKSINNCDINLQNSSLKQPQKISRKKFNQLNQKSECKQQPQRPTTLNFREPPHELSVSEALVQNQRKQLLHRPIRKAPLPPSGAKVYSTSHNLQPTSILSPQQQHQNFHNNFDHSVSSTTSIQSPLSFSDSGDSEISVNISLSPSSDRQVRYQPILQQQQQQQSIAVGNRKISSITLQPEPPYTRDFIPQNNQRSFTSLNLTLRKPSATPQSPIDITAGPGLTYSSSSFDPRRGYQNNFHITVTDQGGIFSASRIRPRSCFVPPIEHPEEEFHDIAGQINLLRPAASSSELNIVTNDIVANQDDIEQSESELILHKNFCLQIIERQNLRKEQLIKAIEKKKKRLELVQQEIIIFKMPEYPGLTSRLDFEIDRLRADCDKLFNQIDKSKQTRQRIDNLEIDKLAIRNQNYRTQPLPQLRPSLPLPEQNYQNNSFDRQHQHHQQQQQQYYQQQQNHFNDVDEDGPQWSCKYCTFLNDPLMIRCEKCDNNREIPGTLNNNNFNSSSSPSTSTSSLSSSLLQLTQSKTLSQLNENYLNNNHSSNQINLSS